MNTRFSPSLNGSLHLGHLYMAWINQSWAQQHNGKFILRFDDLAPRLAGDPIDQMDDWAKQGESLLRQAGIHPDQVTYVSSYTQPDQTFPEHVGGSNHWLRLPNLEGHHNLSCSPHLVAARVQADIAENIGAVIRGEELIAELQLYEYLNTLLNGGPRELIFLPRLRVRTKGEVTTISKTYGNLQLRDLYQQAPPEEWLQKIAQIAMIDPSQPFSRENINRDPIIEVDLS